MATSGKSSDGELISERGKLAFSTPLRVDYEAHSEALENLYHPEENPLGVIPLNVAENVLSWADLRQQIKLLTAQSQIPDWVPGYTSMLGAPSFRAASAYFLEKHLAKCPLDPDHIGVSAGATSVIEMTAFILADPGDVAVIPAPCYPVYKQDIGNMSGLERYDLVTHHELSEIRKGPTLSISDLEHAEIEIKRAGKRFRMLIITNPDNPTGGVYRHQQLLSFADWCMERGIHLVVNEIYGLSLINTKHPLICDDYAEDISFYSFANIMQERQSELLHLWYAFSKDLGISGLRVGLVYSHNEPFIKAYGNVNLSHTVSNYTQWLLQLLISDTDFMSSYLANNCRRLTESYAAVIHRLKQLDIPYAPARGSLFSWLDLSECLAEDSSAAEQDLWLDLYHSAGILLTPGEGFGHSKKGLFRLVYPCVSKDDLEEAMNRLSGFILKRR